jgi:ribosomal protein RSM22 (predicted rRNA methylase)
MRLPDYLETAIQEVSAQAHPGKIAAASQQLTEKYKGTPSAAPAIRSSAERIAYLTARLPATFAANVNVFTELRRRAAETDFSSLLDLGAGPGTALFAAAELFPALQHATLMEADAEWLRVGQKLSAQSPFVAVRHAEWLRRDLREIGELPHHDVVLASYALGELAPSAVENMLRRAWKAARKFLVIIEPGTRRGFAVINTARSSLIAQNAGILAPCPHKSVCPMAAAGDWCHFSQRLERTRKHRRIKGGSLGYEDEKFSYLIASPLALTSASARIVRHPLKHSGHVQLELCTGDGLVRKTVTRSDKEAYKQARQAEWGDEFSG